MAIFVIVDTHVGHVGMIKYHDRPERFDRVPADNWSAVVGRDDVVFHLGDVADGLQLGSADDGTAQPVRRRYTPPDVDW